MARRPVVRGVPVVADLTPMVAMTRAMALAENPGSTAFRAALEAVVAVIRPMVALVLEARAVATTVAVAVADTPVEKADVSPVAAVHTMPAPTHFRSVKSAVVMARSRLLLPVASCLGPLPDRLRGVSIRRTHHGQSSRIQPL